MTSRLQTHLFLSRPGLALATALLITASTCDLPPTFGPEYYDSTINYIAGYPLAAPSVSADAAGGTALDSAAVWDWAWRGRTGNSFEYMTMTDAGTVGTSVTVKVGEIEYTLANDAKVWRVELVNLFRDGNFENPAVDLTPFVLGGATLPTRSISTTSGFNRSLSLVTNGENYVSWQMSVLLLDQAGGFTISPSYYLRFMTWPDLNFPYHVGTQTEFDTGLTEAVNIPPVSSSIVISDRFIGFEATTLFIMSGAVQTTYIDEARVVRADISPVLRVLLRPADTTNGLVPGQYEFSVWMKTDSADRPFNDSGRANENYATQQTTLRISQLSWNESIDALETVKSWDQAYAVNGSWQRLVLRMGSYNNMERFDESSQTAVMELQISPTSLDLYDAGAVLIANPSLNFYINGF